MKNLVCRDAVVFIDPQNERDFDMSVSEKPLQIDIPVKALDQWFDYYGNGTFALKLRNGFPGSPLEFLTPGCFWST